jgi:hypothetical protein
MPPAARDDESYAALRLDDDFFEGTLAPFCRALDSPMAIACLRFLTLCLPERICCISVRTSWPAFLLYLRPLDFFFELELFLLERDLLLELDFFAGMQFSLAQ